jgi:(S)-ureidoglycine aminohydrolase
MTNHESTDWLGHTRSAQRPDHLLQTPETFVRAPLPGMRGATAIVHISRAGRAAFTQYTAEFETGGEMSPAVDQRFVYVLDGQLKVEGRKLSAGHYIYLPATHQATVSAVTASRAAVIEKAHQPLAGVDTAPVFSGEECGVEPTQLMNDPSLEVRALLPDNPAFDFRVNTMKYQPGATLPAVEIHVMEHGLLMLEGAGIYRLSDCWYPVKAGDFIWMAPYCPQWFGALGKTPAKYLIYKDWDRHPR